MGLWRNLIARRVLLGSIVALALGIPWGLHWREQNQLRSALVRAVPDEVPSNPRLYEAALAAGRPAFAQACSGCHRGGEPDPARGIPDLRDADWLYGSGRVIEIENIVLYGIRAGNGKGRDLASMPAFATPRPYDKYKTDPLTPDEISDVTEFLYSLHHPNADAAGATRGRRIYAGQSRGLCWDCHSASAQGDPAIGAPNLIDVVWLYGDGSRQSIYKSVAYGRKGHCPAWIGKLPFQTIRAIALYTYSLSHPYRCAARNFPAGTRRRVPATFSSAARWKRQLREALLLLRRSR
jgi:cytochrome c oxidase cbb3-type subunit 3